MNKKTFELAKKSFNKIFVTHSRPPLVAHLKAMIILNTFDKSRPPRGDALDMYNSLGFRPSHEIVPMLVLGALLIAFY